MSSVNMSTKLMNVFCFFLLLNSRSILVHGEKRLLMNNLDTTQIQDLYNKINQLQRDIDLLSVGNKGPGATYVRWGKKTCDGNSSLVYTGYAAGKSRSEKGSGTNVLCLHGTPRWGQYLDGNQGGRARIYGAEYEPDYGVSGDWVHDLIPDIDNDQNTPCAVCQARHNQHVLMIPGTNVCESGWAKEYDGYLMSSRIEDFASEFICVDHTADYIPGGKNSNQFLLLPTEVQCGTLPCPPFVEGREMTCVVCSN